MILDIWPFILCCILWIYTTIIKLVSWNFKFLTTKKKDKIKMEITTWTTNNNYITLDQSLPNNDEWWKWEFRAGVKNVLSWCSGGRRTYVDLMRPRAFILDVQVPVCLRDRVRVHTILVLVFLWCSASIIYIKKKVGTL